MTTRRVEPPLPVASATPGRTWDFALGLVLCFVTGLAYLPSLRGGFLWNDLDYVTAPSLRGGAGLWRIWTEPGATEQYYPLLHSVFWMECRLWGDHALGYRLATLALHLGSALLFVRLLQRLAVPGAWLAGFFFALHPVHVASVAWIAEQKNTLSLVFYLGAALVYLRFTTTKRPGDYALAALLFFGALLCKTVTATLPAALLVVVWWREGTLRWRRAVRPLIPWFALAALAAVIATWVERHHVGAEGDGFTLSVIERVLVAGRVPWSYLQHLLWPVGLNFIYPRWDIAVTAAQILFPIALLGALGILWAIRQRIPGTFTIALLFLGGLFPVLGFVNLYGALYSWVWDHWQYLADLAPLAGIAVLLTWWAGKPSHRWVANGTGVLLLVLAAVMTWRQASFYSSEESLYRMTLARNPSAWMAHNNLGNLLINEASRRQEAEEHYRAALQLRPSSAATRTNLANALATTPGRSAEAESLYRDVVRDSPGFAAGHLGLGTLLANDPRRRDEALAELNRAVHLAPRKPSIRAEYARVLAADPTRHAEAIDAFREALALDPRDVQVRNNLANLLAAIPGKETEAENEYLQSLRAGPDNALIHCNFANLLARLPGRERDAEEHYHAALRLDPAFAEGNFNLGVFLAAQPGRGAEAAQAYEAALAAQPDYVDAIFGLAVVRARQGQLDEAITLARRGLELAPAHDDLRRALSIWERQRRR